VGGGSGAMEAVIGHMVSMYFFGGCDKFDFTRVLFIVFINPGIISQLYDSSWIGNNDDYLYSVSSKFVWVVSNSTSSHYVQLEDVVRST